MLNFLTPAQAALNWYSFWRLNDRYFWIALTRLAEKLAVVSGVFSVTLRPAFNPLILCPAVGCNAVGFSRVHLQ